MLHRHLLAPCKVRAYGHKLAVGGFDVMREGKKMSLVKQGLEMFNSSRVLQKSIKLGKLQSVCHGRRQGPKSRCHQIKDSQDSIEKVQNGPLYYMKPRG